ncbi:hypothetical protein DPX16_6100 [Anabarilius grahami]|uniref:Uncharacterized protein n=1 Tax=Anabarilius grahami TaxID=495550 RepID=A0A3N0Z1K3_ANAGA|nr:hypothetical protein DPX16_6100 [Anabarilius grahami]
MRELGEAWSYVKQRERGANWSMVRGGVTGSEDQGGARGSTQLELETGKAQGGSRQLGQATEGGTNELNGARKGGAKKLKDVVRGGGSKRLGGTSCDK